MNVDVKLIAQYVYAESSLRRLNDTSSLISPVFSPERSRAACLKLAVYMAGADMGSLVVGQFPEREPSEREVLAELSGNHKDSWQILLVDLSPSLNQTFQLFLEARVGRSYLSDIALDDLELLSGEDCHHLRASYSPPQAWQGEKAGICYAISLQLTPLRSCCPPGPVREGVVSTSRCSVWTGRREAVTVPRPLPPKPPARTSNLSASLELKPRLGDCGGTLWSGRLP